MQFGARGVFLIEFLRFLCVAGLLCGGGAFGLQSGAFDFQLLAFIAQSVQCVLKFGLALCCDVEGGLCVTLRLQILLLEIGGLGIAFSLKAQSLLFGGIQLVGQIDFALLLRPFALLLIPELALQFGFGCAATPTFAL